MSSVIDFHMEGLINSIMHMTECTCTQSFSQMERQISLLQLEVAYLRHLVSDLQSLVRPIHPAAPVHPVSRRPLTPTDAALTSSPPPLYSELIGCIVPPPVNRQPGSHRRRHRRQPRRNP